MKFELPDAATLKKIGADLGFVMTDDYVSQVLTFMVPFGEAFNAVEELPDSLPAVKYPRTAGYKPTGNENKYGAWYVKTTIKGASSGRLARKKVALKDTVCLAGVPMMNGASVLEGYVPDMAVTCGL